MDLTVAWQLSRRRRQWEQRLEVVGEDEGAEATKGLGVSKGAMGVGAGGFQGPVEAPGPA